MTRNVFTVFAPVKGAIVPLDQVPDLVFNQRMLGDGAAIDPADGTVAAPFDGKIININPNLHAFVLAAQNGLELLVHIGLDTVKLHGKGFTPLAKVGDTVTQGQPILQFDLARIGAALKVPFVLCIITAPSHVKVHPADCEIVQAGQPLFTVQLSSAKLPAPEGQNDWIESYPFTVKNEHGLHARPAGLLARLCGTYPHAISICKQNQCANAKSIIGIMGLAVLQGEQVTFRLEGPQEEAEAFISQLNLFFAGK